MVASLKEFVTSKMPILKPIDIADVILYVLGTPQHVNVSKI